MHIINRFECKCNNKFGYARKGGIVTGTAHMDTDTCVSDKFYFLTWLMFTL